MAPRLRPRRSAAFAAALALLCGAAVLLAQMGAQGGAWLRGHLQARACVRVVRAWHRPPAADTRTTRLRS
jgi:hypothetical protein